MFHRLSTFLNNTHPPILPLLATCKTPANSYLLAVVLARQFLRLSVSRNPCIMTAHVISGDVDRSQPCLNDLHPTFKARQKTFPMHQKRDGFSIHPSDAHLDLLNSAASTTESEVELAEFSVELRPLIKKIRATIAESRRLRTQRHALTDSTKS